MTIRVSPYEKNPTHHISLSDGETTLGFIITNVKGESSPLSISAASTIRTAVKTTSGNTKYSDFEQPWTPIAQEDWSGGRGKEDFDDDVTRFFDSKRINSSLGTLMLGPQEQYATGYKSQDFYLPGSVTWKNILYGTKTQYIASYFTASATYTVQQIQLYIRRRGTPGMLTISLCSNGASLTPGTVIASATVTTSNITDTLSEFYKLAISASFVLGTTYWIKITVDTSDENNYWQIGVSNTQNGTTFYSTDASVWSVSPFDLYYRVSDNTASPAYVKFFQYKRSQYVAISGDSGSPKIYRNGDVGVADANTGALSTTIDATKTWTANKWVGAILVLVGGTGSNESKPWRKIVSNTATTITVDSPWIVTQDTTTEYAIVGTNLWSEWTGHGLTAPVTDILVVNNWLYVAQGDAVNMRRIRWYQSSGAYTETFVADGTNKAVFLTTVRDASDGLVIWKANNLDSNSQISVAKATVVTTWGDLTFGTAVPFVDDYGKITSILEYGSTKLLWVFREGSVFNITSGKPDEIPLREMHSAQTWQNGQATLVHGVYLYFNLGSGLERYYDSQLTDLGPNKDSGMPGNRQGIISSMTGYPGKFFVNIDGGSSNYSSILLYNLLGYHEIYRSPSAGERILSSQVQVIPGSDQDRLWFNSGSDMLWLSLPSLTVDPSKDSSSTYVHEGAVEFGYMYASLFDITKLYNSVKLFGEKMSAGTVFVEADYKLDNDATWTPVDGEFDTSPKTEIPITDDGISGSRIRIRLRLMTTSNTSTPIIKTAVVECVSKVPPKYSYSFTFRNGDNEKNLSGEPEDIKLGMDRSKIISNWSKNVTQLHMHSIYDEFDDKKVFIDPPPVQPFASSEKGYTYRLVVTEIE